MLKIDISRPKAEEIEKINEFFKLVLIHTFERNGILELTDLLEEEIIEKRKCLNQDFRSSGRDRYFLIAKDEDKIVGSVEYGPSNDLIHTCTNGKLKHLVEIGTVFVHPNYQKQGIGSRMLNLLFKEMQNQGIEEFCLDSGYKSAQKIWIHKFGTPEYHLKNYWGDNADHMIWRIKLSDVIDE